MGKNSNTDNKSEQKSRRSTKTSDQNGSVDYEEIKNVPNSKCRKKIWSSEALKEKMSPTCEELDFRKQKSAGSNIMERYSRLFKCTKCQKYLKFTIQQNKKVPVHPFLGVLLCDQCRAYYEDGEFSLDSDGEDKYCKWCGEGGTIFTCTKCICGFCASCIKQHFSSKFFKNVKKDENWLCFICDPKPLWFLRFICSLAVQWSEETETVFDQKTQISPTLSVNEQKNNTTTGNLSSKRKRLYIYSSSSDETECEASKSPLKKFKFSSSPLKNLIKETERKSFKNVRSGPLCEIQKLLKLSEYQMSFGVTWCHDTLKKLAKSDCKLTEAGLVDECKKIKWFLSVMSTYLVQFCNSVDSVERSLCKNDEQKTSDNIEKHQSPYTIILQFLDFINNQVKTFVQKGISFSDILEAVIYDDGEVIGLKKKSSLKHKEVDPTTSEWSSTIEDSENYESQEDNIEDDISRGEDSLDLISETDQNMESSFLENSDSSPDTSFRDHSIEVSDTTQEIQKLLSILENA